MVTNIVTMLIENIPLLITAALQLLTGLAQGLVAALPVLIEALPEIITARGSYQSGYVGQQYAYESQRGNECHGNGHCYDC